MLGSLIKVLTYKTEASELLKQLGTSAASRFPSRSRETWLDDASQTLWINTYVLRRKRSFSDYLSSKRVT